ncbi:MAG: aldolase/citrate lyase family protein [Thermodesulfobacteriota bacterium]
MKFLKDRVYARELLAGAWCNLASSLTAEMAARLGYDWVLFDQEHGPGDNMTLLHQMQAVEAWPVAPLVRVVWNDMPLIKRVLDLGAAGVMVPYVQSRAEAEQAVRATRYPPAGLRGVASTPRCSGFGQDFEDYFQRANRNLLTIIQVETRQALAQVSDLAAVEGVDVLFVGPLDLSVSLDLKRQFAEPAYREALAKVGQAAADHGKAAGILLPGADLIPLAVDLGFTFLAVGSDGGLVRQGLAENLQALKANK